jgi:alpha-ribazole phosphatase
VQIFLIRHPRPLVEAGICYGRLDVDCEDPLPVAARIRSVLPAGTPVISSPLRRARHLAEALDPQARVDSRLREIDFGDWEGQAWNDIDRNALDAWAADVLDFTPPGGESVASLQRRAIGFAASLDRINTPRVVLVTHAGIIRALIGHWRQLPVEQWTQLKFDFGSVTEIESGKRHETTQT